MPSEKFYPSLNGDNKAGHTLEVAWSKDHGYDKVYVMGVAPSTDPQKDFEVLSFDLDREDLNRLIRSLRRARNAVYGSDE